MKKSIKLTAILFVFALSIAFFASCKEKETTMDETTTMDVDTLAMPADTIAMPKEH
jgi:hypothetical protein